MNNTVIKVLNKEHGKKVKLGGKKVGTIKPVEGGWQYFPLNHKQGGEIYPTIQLVQKSLEFEDED